MIHPHVRITLHLSDYSRALEDHHVVIPLDAYMTREGLGRSIDFPSKDAPAFVARHICTPKLDIKRILADREAVSKSIADEVARRVMEILSEQDTIMGYPKGHPNAKEPDA